MAAPRVFSRLAVFQAPCVAARSMATLKDIRLRLRAVKNIQKITKSMKMVSAAKYARAERELKPARVYGAGNKAVGPTLALLEKADVKGDASKPNHLVVAITSDRGLCGGIHSTLCKAIKANLAEKPPGTNTVLLLCGDKLRGILSRTHAKNIMLTMSEMGKKPPIFEEASFIAQAVLDTGFEFNYGQVYFNRFRSVISYAATAQNIVSLDTLSNAESMSQYDDVDADVMRNYHEFSLAGHVYYALKEQACSEQSARMTAMDSASKNAGEMIGKLTLTYNRTRQAVITTELTEIISGSVSLESKD